MQYKDRTDRENLTEDEAAVSRLLGDLRRVQAPPDFDFKLNARIANASPAQAEPSRFVPMMKFAVPLCLLLFLASGFFVLNGTFTTETANGPADAAPAATEPSLKQAAAENPTEIRPEIPESSASEFAPAETPVVERAAVIPKERAHPRTRTAAAANTGSGSIQRDLTISSNTIRPPVSPTSELANTSEPQAVTETGADRDAVKVLSSIGADANFVGGELKVRSVRSRSAAESAGLKAGDVVHAVDGRAVNERTMFDTALKTASLSVIREGKPIQITLENK